MSSRDPGSLRPHGLADLVPEMRPAEWQAFLDDIRERGILEPLHLAPDERTVLDGRHRLKAAHALALAQVPVRPVDLAGRSELEYLIRSALHRRHLSDDQRAVLASRLAAELAGQGRRRRARGAAQARWGSARGPAATTGHEAAQGAPRSREVVAESFGVPIRKIRTAGALETVAPQLSDEVLAGRLTLKEAQASWERQRQLDALRAMPDVPADERTAVWCGDFRQRARELAAGSVGMILTDPPYGEAGIEFWEPLAETAARVLRPGGFLVTYTGHLCLPEVLSGLARYLDYYWLALIPFRGHKPAIHERQVRTGYRLVPIFLKPPLSSRPWFHDVIAADNAPDKRFHDWGQSVKPARYLVSRFSRPGDLVLDPFCGAGSFLVAALSEGRRALGIELHPEHVAVARKRSALAAAGRPDQVPLQKSFRTDAGQRRDR